MIRSGQNRVLSARGGGALKMPGKRAFQKTESRRVFGQGSGRRKAAFRAGLYARVSTHDQQTLSMQNRALREYAARRGWTVVMQVKEVGSGAAQREAREKLLEAARRREIDTVLVWRLDRWGRSVADLLSTLQELEHLGVGFVSLTEALDLTTPAGRAMAGLLAVFAEFEREILRERVRDRLGPCPAEREAPGSARHGRPARRSSPQAAPLRTQQIGHRPPPQHWSDLGAPHSGDRKGVGMAGKKRTFLTALGKPAKERRQIARRKSSFGAERARARVDSETHLRRRGANRPFAYRAQARRTAGLSLYVGGSG